MYILPKDLHGESNDMIPHRFDVDIIKDCSSLRHEIADVFNVLDRNSGTYYTSIEKVLIRNFNLSRKKAKIIIVFLHFSVYTSSQYFVKRPWK